jgi:2-dehydro-3-deoxyphosphooctonate aldolase (KDO 8-P synthase)
MNPSSPFTLISGPCVIEDEAMTLRIASRLKELTSALGIAFTFKASYDKANRTAITSYRGPGIRDGLQTLARIKAALDIAIISDVHRISEIPLAAECWTSSRFRLLVPADRPDRRGGQNRQAREHQKGTVSGSLGHGQYRRKDPVGFQRHTHDHRTGRLVRVQQPRRGFRGIRVMQQTGCPVIFDATHSVQCPAAPVRSSGGQREFAPVLARAAMAAGVDGIFMEVHENPDTALCDGPNSLPLDALPDLLQQLKAIHAAVAR